VDGYRDFFVQKRFFGLELFFERAQQGHVAFDPFNLLVAGIRQ